MPRFLRFLLCLSVLSLQGQDFDRSQSFDSLYNQLNQPGISHQQALHYAHEAEKVFRAGHDSLGWLGPIHVLWSREENQGQPEESMETILLGLEYSLEVGDTIAVTHYLAHFFQDRTWNLPPEKTNEIYQLLWLILDYH
jgi:hypothetical protein